MSGLGARAEVVSLRQAAAPAPHDLPAQLTSFVGRERELADVVDALAATRLLTLTGAGGCGKTRLALQAAVAALERHPGGVWCVELAALADPGLVAPALARALGVGPGPGASDLDAALAYLAPRRALVLLDNCEHVLEECARVAEALARSCAHVTVLATSREPLGVAGETDWRVPSLSLPPGGDGASARDAIASDAVRLFAERAAKVRPGFALDDANAAAVVRICRALDGIPLAIELAAARLRVLSPAQIADGLSDRFRLLTGGVRTALPRQRTLRASVDWSHDLLDERERIVLRRLGVLTGGFGLEAAEAVCAGDGIDRADVLDLLASLVEKSLVNAGDAGATVRYGMLETVRRYALDRLAEAGEAGVARDRHLDFHLELAERLAPELVGPRQRELLPVVDAETANLDAALEHAAATEPDTALRLAAALALPWRLRGHFTRAEAAFARALAAAGDEPTPLRARALWGRAYLLAFAGDFAAAVPLAEWALAEAERAGDAETAARAGMVIGKAELMCAPPAASRARLEAVRDAARASGDELCLMHAGQALAFGHMFEEDHRAALRLFDDVLPVIERNGQDEFLSNHWTAHGWARYVEGDLEGAREMAERGVAAARAIGDPAGEAGAAAYAALVRISTGEPGPALERLEPVRGRAVARGAGFLLPWAEIAIAQAHAAEGRLERARELLEQLVTGPAGAVIYTRAWASVLAGEAARLAGDARAAADGADRALEIAERIGNEWLAARARLLLGRLALERGERALAERLCHEALAAIAARGYRLELPRVLEALADVAHGLESHVEAARILGAARRLRASTGLVAWAAERDELDATAASLRATLGDEAFASALAEGAALAPDEAVAWLRRARGERKRPSGGWEALTATELEVVRHAAAGLTNPQIGERMFISRSTVKAHLAHVYAKLGVRNRAELAREAADRREPALDRAR